MRYSITEEVTKHGRKKEVQYCVYDALENRVIVRYADKKRAQAVIDQYESLLLED